MYLGGGPRVVVSTAAFHARVRGSVPGLGGLKETKLFLPHPRVKVSTVGSLRDREVTCSASDRQGSNFESCVWRTVSSQSSHHPQEVLLAQFSLYVHKGGLKPDSFHFISTMYLFSFSLYRDFRRDGVTCRQTLDHSQRRMCEAGPGLRITATSSSHICDIHVQEHSHEITRPHSHGWACDHFIHISQVPKHDAIYLLDLLCCLLFPPYFYFVLCCIGSKQKVLI